MEAGWTIEVVAHVVFARPLQLDRLADDLCDPCGFDHVVVGQSSTEAATNARLVNRDVGIGHTQRLRHERASRLRRLARSPDFELAVLEVRRAVHRLEWSMG